MTAFKVDIDLDDAAMQAAFRRLIKSGQDLSPLWRDFGEHLVLTHEERWESGVAPDGQSWAALKPATIARKKGHKPLFEEGDMLRGLVNNPRSKSLEVGISDEKGAWHHFGTSRGLPSRKLVGLSREDKAVLLEMAEDFIRDASL